MGKAGLESYNDLLPFIGDEEENVAMHAIAGFGPDAPPEAIEELVTALLTGDDRSAPAASEALRVIGTVEVLRCLVEVVQTGGGRKEWAINPR